jgi:Protein of unknown function (DUF4244)
MASQYDHRRSLRVRSERLRHQTQAGMTTAEYAVGTLAACPQHTSPS